MCSVQLLELVIELFARDNFSLSELDFYSHNIWGWRSRQLWCLWRCTQGVGILHGMPRAVIHANDMKNAEKKHAILLSVCRVETYQVTYNLTTSGKPTDHSFKELVELMLTHCSPLYQWPSSDSLLTPIHRRRVRPLHSSRQNTAVYCVER